MASATRKALARLRASIKELIASKRELRAKTKRLDSLLGRRPRALPLWLLWFCACFFVLVRLACLFVANSDSAYVEAATVVASILGFTVALTIATFIWAD